MITIQAQPRLRSFMSVIRSTDILVVRLGKDPSCSCDQWMQHHQCLHIDTALRERDEDLLNQIV